MRYLITMVLALMMQSSRPLLAVNSSQHSVRSEMVVSTSWLGEHLKDPAVVVLCVASNPEFYTRGHIPGAHFLAFDQIVTPRDGIPNELPPVEQLRTVFAKAGVTNNSRIVLYGERLGLLAARAYFTLDYLGLADDAALLDGGIEKWRTEERPESKDAPQVIAQPLQVKVRPEVLVSAKEIEAMLKQPFAVQNVALIDARPREEFTGDRLSEDVAQGGHIPGAASLYWMNNLVSKEHPVLRSPEELRAIFEQAAVEGKHVITYCRTGMQSSFDYFIAKYLGHKVAMYDGSFLEWSREGLPIEKTR